MKFFVGSFSWEYFCSALASSVYYSTIAKYSQENFRGTLKNSENHDSSDQQIFQCSQYFLLVDIAIAILANQVYSKIFTA